MQPKSIHDNHVVGYEVDAEARRLVLRTVSEVDPEERSNIVFAGVMAYHLENDNFINILFDVTEVDLDGLLEANRDSFEQGRLLWPGTWNASDGAARQFLKARGANAWEIVSSYGLRGWVICESCSIQAA